MNTNLLQRYSRQIVLPEIGTIGQQYISNAKVLCIGAGGLGSTALKYLTASGIGTIGIVEDDHVELTNLHRQILYTTDDLGKDKLDCTVNLLSRINPNVIIKPYSTKLAATNAYSIMRDYDIVIDGTDNFTTKFLINDCAVKVGVPIVYGSIFGFEGQVATFFAKKGPCYRCLYPMPPKNHIPNCAENGVLGPMVGILGSIQALECIKIILSQLSDTHFDLQSIISKLFILNGKSMSTSQYTINKSSNCSICSKSPEEIKLHDHKDNNLIHDIKYINVLELKSSLSNFHIIDIREQAELHQGRIPSATHLPFSKIMQKNIDLSKVLNLSKNHKKICLYCQNGFRSIKVLNELTTLGIKNLYSLKGGYTAWMQ